MNSAVPEAAVLLLSSDASLIESCQGVAGSIPNVALVVLSHDGEVDSYLEREDLALVLVHVVDNGGAGEASRLLQAIATLQRPVATIVLSEQHDPNQALSLLRQGAADYLSRPLDLARLAYLIDSLTVRARYAPTHSAASGEAKVRRSPGPLPDSGAKVGNDPLFDLRSAAAGPLVEQVRLVAPQDTIVLLGGETGSGKTRLARLIHELSPRRGQPFLVINCGALAANLIESEMFGHVKGAFTGADRDRIGKFAGAGRGTLLLDDIDSLPLSLQAKLLVAIGERVFEPVGSNKSVPVQARLIAASNRALEQEVEAGRFRADLYYRLDVVTFYLPPLRERPHVIPQLASGFLAEFAARNGRSVRTIAADALYALESYSWPGNIRELRNVIERAVTFCPGPEIRPSDLPETIRSAVRRLSYSAWAKKPAAATFASRLKEVRLEAEASHILDVLRRHGNNRMRAAAELGISRMTLYNKLREYSLINPA